MKMFITILCLLFPVIASAQGQGFDMAKMGQAMQEMMVCMGEIDQAELAALQEKSEKMGEELEALCTQGKRDEAQKKAIAYSKEMMKSPVMKQMEKCGEIAKKYNLPQSEEEDSAPFMKEDFEKSDRHVCDEFEEE